LTLSFPHEHPDHPDLTWSEALGLVSIEAVSVRGKEFIRQTGFDDWMFASGERLEQLERAIAEWNLVVDYDPEPDQETLDLQKSLGERLRRWKAEVGWIDKDSYDQAKVEAWRRKFLAELE